jgi:hypothetical protein
MSAFSPKCNREETQKFCRVFALLQKTKFQNHAIVPTRNKSIKQIQRNNLPPEIDF